jgi:hypothetical protein
MWFWTSIGNLKVKIKFSIYKNKACVLSATSMSDSLTEKEQRETDI